jgi:NAD(P)-dependent dehydrogenase (short-subunit alcohol dehydrogenase family)
MIAAAIHSYGRLDAAFNNAGVTTCSKPMVDAALNGSNKGREG